MRESNPHFVTFVHMELHNITGLTRIKVSFKTNRTCSILLSSIRGRKEDMIFRKESLDANRTVLAGTNDVGHPRKCSASVRKSSATPPQPCARCAEACSPSARPSYTSNARPGYLRFRSQHGRVRSTHPLPAGPWISHILSTMNTGKRKARRF